MGQTQGSPAENSSSCSKSLSCRPCSEWGDKKYNTVKVDTTALPGQGKNKENTGPNGQMMSKEEQERHREIEERDRHQEEARKAEEQQRILEQQVREEQERQLAERQHQEEERRRLQAEQELREREELHRRQEEDRRRQEEERAAAEAEKARQEEEARQLQLDAENRKAAAAWLATNGFKSIDELHRKGMSKVRPLHVAVKSNDANAVRMLLEAGADRKLVNGSKKIPLEVAHKLDKQGSHSAVIMALLGQPAAASQAA